MATEEFAESRFVRLQVPIDSATDHIRGNRAGALADIVVYGDYFCPYCRRLRIVIAQLEQVFSDRLGYVFRHFPNEAAHPGATYAARVSEAAGAQGRFWEMHDRLYGSEPPITEGQMAGFARDIGLDIPRFESDLQSAAVSARVDQDITEGHRNGVTGTPTIFINGVRYEGAWDLYSMLEALERPLGMRVRHSARAFANLPASGGLVLLLAAAAALICANTGLAPYYHLFIESHFNIGPPQHSLSLTIGDWMSEGLLAIFFVLVGLGVRRGMTDGPLGSFRAAILPVVAAVGGVLMPAALYLLVNSGAASSGWSVPTATDIAFALGILALFGSRVPQSLRVFVAALAVVDDILSVLTLAIFYPKTFSLEWIFVSAATVLILVGLNRGRVYAAWPYVLLGGFLWFALHSAGIHAALAGIFLAAVLPDRPRPAVTTLLAQAATALSTLEHAEKSSGQPTPLSDRTRDRAWDWASKNLTAASDRLLSPADRVESAIEPWSNYVILPLFAFSASGIGLGFDLSSPSSINVFLGVILGLVVGKPLGIFLASRLAVLTRIASAPEDTDLLSFVGAACLCGIGDTVALLMADQAFPGQAEAYVAKTGVLVGSVLAAALGAGLISLGARRSQTTPA